MTGSKEEVLTTMLGVKFLMRVDDTEVLVEPSVGCFAIGSAAEIGRAMKGHSSSTERPLNRPPAINLTPG